MLGTTLPAAAAGHTRAATANVVVNLRSTYQTIQGFGSSERAWTDPHLANAPKVTVPPAAEAQILTALYRRLGLTMVRDMIDAGIQGHPGAPYNFAAKADAQAAFAKQARRYGLKTFFPAPVYLEDWMQPSDPAAYVDWAMALLQRWRALGATPPYYSVLNEPQVARNFPPQWLHDVVVQLGKRMRAAGFKTKLVIPDDENPIDAYRRAEAVLQDPQARQYVGAVAFHIYRIGGPPDWARMRRLATQYRLPLWMTEWWSDSYGSYPGALDWAVKMDELLTAGGVNALNYLWGFFGNWQGDQGALVSIQFDNGVYQSWHPTPLYYLTGQFSKYIRPGDRRVGATSAEQSLLVSAYKGSRRTVVVAVNTAQQAQPLSVKVVGGKVGKRFAVVQTTSAAGLKPLPALRIRSGSAATVLPPQSVTTLVSVRR